MQNFKIIRSSQNCSNKIKLSKSTTQAGQNLHQKFVQLAQQRKNLTRKLHALLPEIYKQEIYKQKGCFTIYEYAWKYAGFSKNLVNKILQVGKNVENLPNLKKTIETQGIHKVGMVATLATPETDKNFAEHVSNMSKAALFQFSKELRHRDENKGENETAQLNLDEATNGKAIATTQKCHAATEKIKIELDNETQILFLQLKKKLRKEFKINFSNKEALKIIFKKLIGENPGREVSKSSILNQYSIPGNGIKSQSTPRKKPHPGAKTQPNVVVAKVNRVQQNQKATDKKIPSRYIPKSQEKEILQKHNHQCAYPNCNKPYETLHHRERFASSKNHESIIPLCKEHHEFMHNGLIKNEINEPENWELKINPDKNFIDKLFLKYRFRPEF